MSVSCSFIPYRFLVAEQTRHTCTDATILLEPAGRNTAPAILSTALINDIPNEQPLMYLAADHLIEKVGLFNKAIKKNQKKLTHNNIFIFGIKPTMPSSEFGYFLTKSNKVTRFVEKPKEAKAKQKVITYATAGGLGLVAIFLIFVFQKLFGYSLEKATELMLDVHEKGKAVVSSGSKEKSEMDVYRLHEHGLWATMQQDAV